MDTKKKASGISRLSAKKLCIRAGVERSDGHAVKASLNKAASLFLAQVLNHAIVCSRAAGRIVVNDEDIKVSLKEEHDIVVYALAQL